MKELWNKLESMREIMGDKALLDELCQAMSKDELEENLEYIDRMNDLNIFDKNDDESEDE